ncbi:MAG: aminotransferase class V-fold PLP-dependent enzyme, partial [Limosilactobacillus mucosae]
MTVYNFAAGPAVLPKEVLKKVQAELLNFNDSGMSILEISHRSQLFVDVYEDAKARIYKLMNLDDHEYDVLFMQGGGTTQFTAVPLNLTYQHHRAAYIDTGHWSERAVEEARLIKGVEADILASSKDQHYTTLPKVPAIPQDTYDYVHITTNNTIMGTAWQKLPETDGTPLVGDLSSNFL